jgi:hypothetical protein
VAFNDEPTLEGILRKRLIAILAVALAAISLGGNLGPAHADGPYNIRAGLMPTWPSQRFPNSSSGAVTELTFVQRRCDKTLLNTPLQGMDAYILDATDLTAKTVTISWTWSNYTTNKVYVNMYQPDCRLNGSYSSVSWAPSTLDYAQTIPLPESGTMSFPVPTGIRWLVVAPEAKVDLNFTVTAS